MLVDDADCDELFALERELLTQECRADVGRLESLLHNNFREHGASGRIWYRAEMLEMLPTAEPCVDEASGFECQQLADDVVLVTYRITGRRPSLRSSVWVFGVAGWQLLFHQGTLI